ncbi:MAG: hypothetical protein ABJL54_12555 [Halioglobus sp.]
MSFYKCFFLSLVASTAIFASEHSGADEFDIWPVPNTNFGTWSDGGTLSASVTGCIESYKGNKTKNYRLTLSGDSSDNDFYLYRNGDTSQTGNNRIRIDISARDLMTRPTYETFSNGSEISKRKGQKNNCPNGVNGQLQFLIPESALEAASGGNFSAFFELSGRGGHRERKTDSTTFQVSITVSSPQVQISGLQDLVLSTDPTSSAGMTADEAFCVYSSATDYRISISSSEYNEGGFALASGFGEKIGIALLYADNASGTNMQSVQPAVALTGAGDGSSNTCTGSSNATLRISVSEQTIREATTGNYAATLTLLVEPI